MSSGIEKYSPRSRLVQQHAAGNRPFSFDRAMKFGYHHCSQRQAPVAFLQKLPLMKTVYRTLIFPLFILTAVAFTASQDDPVPIKATINYSAAPWDDAAYEILAPLPKTKEGSEPFIRIDIWGNPEYQTAKSFHFSKEGSRKEGGRAAFQRILNKSMPVTLTGTVSFKALKKDHPVVGSFELVDPDGKTFKAAFEASWGNKPLPYIR